MYFRRCGYNYMLCFVLRYNDDEYPIEDCDETARFQRALEIAVGVEPPPGFTPNKSHTAIDVATENAASASVLVAAQQLTVAGPPTATAPNRWHMVCRSDATGLHFVVPPKFLKNAGDIARVHSQVCTYDALSLRSALCDLN